MAAQYTETILIIKKKSIKLRTGSFIEIWLPWNSSLKISEHYYYLQPLLDMFN